MRGSCRGWLHIWVAENWLGNASKRGISQSGEPNGHGRWGIRHLGWLLRSSNVIFAYLDFLMITDGPGMTGSQWNFFTLEGSGLPLATIAGWGIAACVGPLCLVDRVLKGYFFSGLSHATGGFGIITLLILWVAAKLGTWNDTIPNLSDVA